MAPSRKRSIKSASIPSNAIEQTATALQSLPEREKETLSLRETIAQLQTPIRTALDRGYSYEEVTAMLAEQGINISMFSLKRYLSLTRSKLEDGATNEQGKRKTRRTRAAKEMTESADVEDAPEEEPVEKAAPETKAKRQRKSTTDATPASSKSAAKTRSSARTTTRKPTSRGRRKSSS